MILWVFENLPDVKEVPGVLEEITVIRERVPENPEKLPDVYEEAQMVLEEVLEAITVFEEA